ncbi:hypothetical protein NWO25_01780 [Enterococcus lactis]|nr:hypothetical protein [Enterococcus lactis]
MNDMPNEYLSLEENLSSKMSRKLGEKYGLTELEEAKSQLWISDPVH